MIFPITVMALIHTLPESPRWCVVFRETHPRLLYFANSLTCRLVKMERIPEAREVFSAVYEQPTDSETVNKMITDIELSISLGQHSRLRDLFKMGPQRTLHRLMLAAIIQMYLQMTGVNAITYYAAQVYELYLGFTVDKAQILSSSAFFVVILGSCVCSFTVDRYGRRALMLTSSIGMVICQVCLAGLVSQQQNAAALKAAVFFMFTYYLVYTLGFLGLPFLYASEVAPVHLRGAVCGISTAVSWLFNFLVAEITPVAFADIGYQYFIVFAAINASAIPVVYCKFAASQYSLRRYDALETNIDANLGYQSSTRKQLDEAWRRSTKSLRHQKASLTRSKWRRNCPMGNICPSSWLRRANLMLRPKRLRRCEPWRNRGLDSDDIGFRKPETYISRAAHTYKSKSSPPCYNPSQHNHSEYARNFALPRPGPRE